MGKPYRSVWLVIKQGLSVGMAKTRSMTRNQNHDDDSSSSSSRKRFKNLDNHGVASWSDLNHDVLSIVMMQLGFVDFFAFSGVCKSWRSFALSSRNMFMASKPPMPICTIDYHNWKDSWYLEDFEGRRFKTFLPHTTTSRRCYGITCGYLIFLCGNEFWLVNPVTKHELHFPGFPLYVAPSGDVRAILVFSPSISGWVLVVLHRKHCRPVTQKLLFYISGKPGWNHVFSTLPSPSILDLHAFKGKMYTLHTDFSVRELRFHPHRKRKWTLLETKNFPKPDLSNPELVSSGENLYVIDKYSRQDKVLELDIGEMKWVLPEKTIGEYAFFYSGKKSAAAIKPVSWTGPTGPRTRYKCYDTDKIQQDTFHYNRMWYFPHDCLNVNLLDE